MPPECGCHPGEPRRKCGGPLRILGARIDPVTPAQALDQIQEFLQSAQAHHVITGNTLMCLEAEYDPALRWILEQAALVTPESWGIRWASKVLGYPPIEFFPGIDLMLMLCGLAADAGRSIFLLGSAPGVAEVAAKVLRERYPGLKIVGVCHGFFSIPHPNALPSGDGTAERRERGDLTESDVLQLIRQAKPSLLFVGLGMPAQEKWIALNLMTLNVPVVMGIGGSFDVLSGKLKRAPAWMRRQGIEWVYRLVREPWRWRRIAQLPVFMWKVMAEKSRNQKSKSKVTS